MPDPRWVRRRFRVPERALESFTAELWLDSPLGLEVHQPEQVSDDPRVAGAGFDVVVVCAYGALLREPLLSHPGLLNVHPSLLPRWRGAAPIERAIMAGDAETGVAIMRPTEGFDEGPLCAVEREEIRPRDDYETLAARLEDLSARLLLRVLAKDPAAREVTAKELLYELEACDVRDLRPPPRPAGLSSPSTPDGMAVTPRVGATPTPRGQVRTAGFTVYEPDRGVYGPAVSFGLLIC